MTEYHKIQTVFKRSQDNNFRTLLMDEYSKPEFEYLADNQWIFTEKVDGTNIRIMYQDGALSFGGKTDKAEIPPYLMEALENLNLGEKVKDVFEGKYVCLYGEGYGPKIQKVGKLYREDHSFVLFDIKIGSFWLNRDDVLEIGEKLDLDVVPVIGAGTLETMVNKCIDGFNSTWGDFKAEGIVARPEIELKARNGERIITKLKLKDFEGVDV